MIHSFSYLQIWSTLEHLSYPQLRWEKYNETYCNYIFLQYLPLLKSIPILVPLIHISLTASVYTTVAVALERYTTFSKTFKVSSICIISLLRKFTAWRYKALNTLFLKIQTNWAMDGWTYNIAVYRGMSLPKKSEIKYSNLHLLI